MGYTVSTASLRRYHDDTLVPHAEALRALDEGHAGRPTPPFPAGLTGTADLFEAVGGRLGQVLTEAARHASASRTRLAETARRYDAAETANLLLLGGADATPAAGAAVPPSAAPGDPPVVSGDSRDLLAELRSATDRLSSVVAPLGGLPLVRPAIEQLWANAVDPRHYDTAASVHAAHARHIADLRSRLRPMERWDGTAHDGFEADRNRHLAALDDAEAHSRRLSAAYGEMAASMRAFLSHMALAIGAFLAAFALTLFVSHFFEAALFLCLAEIAAFALYLVGWLAVRLVHMARTVRRTLDG